MIGPEDPSTYSDLCGQFEAVDVRSQIHRLIPRRRPISALANSLDTAEQQLTNPLQKLDRNPEFINIV